MVPFVRIDSDVLTHLVLYILLVRPIALVLASLIAFSDGLGSPWLFSLVFGMILSSATTRIC